MLSKASTKRNLLSIFATKPLFSGSCRQICLAKDWWWKICLATQRGSMPSALAVIPDPPRAHHIKSMGRFGERLTCLVSP